MATPVNNVTRLVPGLVERLGRKTVLDEMAPEGAAQANFTEMFSNFLNGVNDAQHSAGQAQQAFMSGEPIELHDVMIKAEEAGLTMDLLLEIRNKLLNAYNELMRMPI
ncbi:MAG: flagellar hook-basal body complex protein FliE [Candidatus Zixiibacteriota bacterium]